MAELVECDRAVQGESSDVKTAQKRRHWLTNGFKDHRIDQPTYRHNGRIQVCMTTTMGAFAFVFKIQILLMNYPHNWKSQFCFDIIPILECPQKIPNLSKLSDVFCSLGTYVQKHISKIIQFELILLSSKGKF